MANYTKLKFVFFLSTFLESTLYLLVPAYANNFQEETLKALNQQMVAMNQQIVSLKKELSNLKTQLHKPKGTSISVTTNKHSKFSLPTSKQSLRPVTVIASDEATPSEQKTLSTIGSHNIHSIPNTKYINVSNPNDEEQQNQHTVLELLHSNGLPPPDRGASFWSPNMPILSSATLHDESVYVGGLRIGFPGGRPTLATDDGVYSFSIGLALHKDMGGFIDSGVKADETKGRFSAFRANLRRARIPFTFRYKNYSVNVTPDFGSAVDGSVGLYEANFQYGGFTNTILTLGYFEPRVTLEGAESSNEGLMMERPASTELARGIAAGDARFSIGGVTYGKRWYVGSYFTGHSYGAHTTNASIINDQTGGLLRVAGRPYVTKNTDVHLGFSTSSAFNVAQTDKGRQFNFSAIPELRLTQETLIATGALNNINSVWHAGPEFALRYQRAYFKAEYMKFGFQRSQGMRNLYFEGYYAALNYTLFGSPRSYDIRAAAFRAPGVTYDFDPTTNHWGALEASARWSVVNLNSHKCATDGANGGQQTVWSTGVNWYPSPHIRVMLDYDHIIASSVATNSIVKHGRNIDAIAARFQAAF